MNIRPEGVIAIRGILLGVGLGLILWAFGLAFVMAIAVGISE